MIPRGVRRPAAQQRAAPTSQDRREVPGLEARSPVADAVDAAVLLQESSPDRSLVLDLRFGEALGEQLRTVHNTVRAARESFDPVPGSHDDP